MSALSQLSKVSFGSKGKIPMERYLELSEETPLAAEICEEYDPALERI
jgi:hypothetical protein